MAKKDFTTPLTLNGDYPNLDDRYTNNGDPYTSVSAAQTALASKLNAYHIGLTVLVADENDPDYPKAKEYWVQPKGTTPETYGLVVKGAGTTDYNNLENKPSINGRTLEGNINIEGGTPAQYNEILVDLSQYEYLQAYISSADVLTVGSSPDVRTYLIPVTKGQRFKEYIYPIITSPLYTSSNIFTGFNKQKPAIGTTVDYLYRFQSKSDSANAASTPTAGTVEYIAPDDGWISLYFVTARAEVTVYEMVNDEYHIPIYDTWIEEDIDYQYRLSFGFTSPVATKTYTLKEGVEYKAIYRHISETDYNSYTFYDENGTAIGDSGDSGIVGEHRMEDLVIPEGAKTITFRYNVGNNTKQGNILNGMAALMKPLLDDGTMPKNDIVYCVSKIKKPVMPYNYATEGTTFPQDELWSAWAVRFPSGHTLGGKPTPLAAFFHGSSGYVTSEKMGYPTYGAILHNKFNDKGIAVFDVNGYGISFIGDQYSKHWGCPAAVETVKAAYNVLTERFNCRKGMVLSGISMGGAIIKSYAMTYPEDCVACAMEAPSEMGLTFRNLGEGTNVETGWDTTDVNAICGYTPLANPYFIDTENGNVLVHRNASDWTYSDFIKPKAGATSPYSPVEYEATDLQACAPFPVEAVIWHGDADDNVCYGYSVQFVRTARNAGSNVKLRTCPNCTHDLNLYSWVTDEVLNYIESKLSK